MSLTWLKAFHLVAQEGSFTGAATRLRVSQPTVSSHVKALEQYFKVELFFRRGHQIELTPFGRSLFAITAGLFGHEEEAMTMLRSANNFEEGQLRLGAVGPFDVMALMGELNRKFSRMKISVSLGSAHNVLQQIIEYQTDVGLLGRDPENALYYCMPFRRHKVVVITNRGSSLAKKRRGSISIKELSGENMIVREAESTTRQAFERACRAAKVSPNISLEINSREAIVQAVAIGLGTSIIAETEFMHHPDLKVLELNDADVNVNSFMVCLSERRNRPIIRAAFDVAAKMSAKVKSPDRVAQ
ncbi:LysR substrate-binding domain-containing protein [Bradyrhizobium sp. 26S5]|uniref:LysR substrate-binding domain-containing protein n=1 Tax=Bradyrhizobium sp. 26S5 TaxID=3139729 RepID=UPI0030CE600F